MLGGAEAQGSPPVGQPGEDPTGCDISDVPWRTGDKECSANSMRKAMAVGRWGACCQTAGRSPGFGWSLSPAQQISGRGALKGEQGLYWQGLGPEGFVPSQTQWNTFRVFAREARPEAVFREDFYGSCGRRDGPREQLGDTLRGEDQQKEGCGGRRPPPSCSEKQGKQG